MPPTFLGSCVVLAVLAGVARADGGTPPPVAASSLAAPGGADLELGDLGFTATETAGDPALQRELDLRSGMLKTHQLLALAAAVPMLTEYVIGGDTAHRVRMGGTNTALHVGLGIGTFLLYDTAATFAILAPKPKGVKDTGATRIHRYLAYLHGPLMLATPILGQLANYRVQHHESARGMKDLHSLAATGLLISYGAAMSIMVINF